MQIITLITDWQPSGYYVATLKARLLAALPEITIVDISHRVAAFNTLQAAFLLRHTCTHFPAGTIHLVGVNSEPSPENHLAIAEANGHFFVAPNNGLLSLALDNAPEYITEMPVPGGATGFKALRSFVRAAQAVTAGVVDTVGLPKPLHKSLLSRPAYDGTFISGQVAYVDAYGNAITNIDRSLFETACRKRHFEIYVQSHHNKLMRVSNYYDDVAPGEMLALFNSLQLLEIAVNQGNVAQREQLDTTSSVRIKFLPPPPGAEGVV
ncbi:MAG: SAM-dependent chlorinase/fluorinase [Prevotellaceae bacterium]|jgi:S-adenosylmethionine hydrolase|nr:SAM-dependent chlorinase/fluorinase [Prevotellaceae bacterium]